jgi:hypothetical protein
MLVTSNEPEHSEAWVRMPLLSRIAARGLGFKPFSWHYADAARRPAWLLRAYARWPIEPFNLLIDAFVDAVTMAVLWLMRLCGVRLQLASAAPLLQKEPAPEKALQAAHSGALTRRQAIANEARAARREDAADASADAAEEKPARVSALQALAAPLVPCEPDAATAVSLPADPGASPPLPAHGTRAWDWHVLRRRKHRASKEVRRRLARMHGSRLSSSATTGICAGDKPCGVVQTADEIAANHEEEYVIAVRARVMRSIGLGGIYVCWTFFVWFTFAYGRIVFELLGMRAEAQFLRSWLVALGIDNALQWQAVLTALLHGALVILVIDRLWLVSNSRWIEVRAARCAACVCVCVCARALCVR